MTICLFVTDSMGVQPFANAPCIHTITCSNITACLVKVEQSITSVISHNLKRSHKLSPYFKQMGTDCHQSIYCLQLTVNAVGALEHQEEEDVERADCSKYMCGTRKGNKTRTMRAENRLAISISEGTQPDSKKKNCCHRDGQLVFD